MEEKAKLGGMTGLIVKYFSTIVERSSIFHVMKKREPRPPYTVESAATYLSLSPRTIRNLIKKRVLRTSRITRKILIPAEDVEQLVYRTS